MTEIGDRQLSEVHIKDRSMRLARGSYAKRLADRAVRPAALAESCRKAQLSAIYLRGCYSDRHCQAVAMAAWWQSIADAQKRGKTTSDR